ncbi:MULTISPECIES: PilX N-terminal domain-containing pilus assembly protein [Shewanella]|uniref:pilus assembly PilX family protein n=1 Tax=Shewanella TaxID=22 RepID=UPI0005A2325C|nr:MULTISPECIES: pilus assembly PilX N-terminal domain-containing protein [Shewanella]KIO36186.1 pilus assembly protein PilX [Shewanella sp. cp20]MCG9745613.1 pilus assembly PilX N-terminal domain-containing protein [Shewanella sp. Isolate8]MCL2910386.1 pilus assembly PilX N-terminal domain-containing protein [Shewanella aquimarina]
MNKQKGVVLFFALIVLILMTVIGVALAVNSTQSLRMAGAGAERIEAKALADGGVAAVLLNKTQAFLATMTTIDDQNSFSGGKQVLTPLPLVDDGAGNLIVQPKNVSCQRSAAASGTDLFKCRRIEISSQVSFGRDNLGQVLVVTGIEQEVLSGSGS